MKTALLAAVISFAGVAFPFARTITAAEYYFNSDPGPGNGIPIPILASPAPRITVDVPQETIAALPDGVHFLVARVKDEEDNWSIAFSRPFHKEDPVEIDPRLTRVDYQWYHEGEPRSTPISLTPQPGAKEGAWMPEIPLPIGGQQGETWQLALTAYDTEGAYCVPVASSVKLLAQPPSLEELLTDAFPNANPSELGPLGNPLGDSFTNIEKYYLGLDPLKPTNENAIDLLNPLDFPGNAQSIKPWHPQYGIPLTFYDNVPPIFPPFINAMKAKSAGDERAPVMLRYTRNRNVRNVTGVVQTSTTLDENSWREVEAEEAVIPNDAYTDKVILRPKVSKDESGRQFFRLKITEVP